MNIRLTGKPGGDLSVISLSWPCRARRPRSRSASLITTVLVLHGRRRCKSVGAGTKTGDMVLTEL